MTPPNKIYFYKSYICIREEKDILITTSWSEFYFDHPQPSCIARTFALQLSNSSVFHVPISFLSNILALSEYKQYENKLRKNWERDSGLNDKCKKNDWLVGILNL